MRRGVIGALAVLLAVGLLVVLPGGGSAQQKVAKIGLVVPPDRGGRRLGATPITKGAQLAIDEINAEGRRGAATSSRRWSTTAPPRRPASTIPPRRRRTIRKFIADPHGARVGRPGQMSGEGKAISPILSEADLATITPSSTNPDITDPKFKAQYRPKGKAVYFRTVTTDAYQGPNMANHALPQPEGQEASTSWTTAGPSGWGSPTASRGGRRSSGSRSSAATGSIRRKPTTRPS